MNIGLLAIDSNYPNLALMKLSAWHKQHGDTVQWYNTLDRYDKVYMAKVFTFTPDYGYYINADEVETGGTGYDLHKTLPKSIDRIQPDYTIYPQIDIKTAYGFLTRGCPNRCKWCDGCGKWKLPCKTKRKSMLIATSFKGWKEINGKLYCPDCYEYDEETNEYKPKKKQRNDSTGID